MLRFVLRNEPAPHAVLMASWPHGQRPLATGHWRPKFNMQMPPPRPPCTNLIDSPDGFPGPDSSMVVISRPGHLPLKRISSSFSCSLALLLGPPLASRDDTSHERPIIIIIIIIFLKERASEILISFGRRRRVCATGFQEALALERARKKNARWPL